MGFFSRLFRRSNPLAEARPSIAIVGLGNPGPQYAGTRHNVGFAAVDRLADRLGVALTARVDDALVATVTVQREEAGHDEAPDNEEPRSHEGVEILLAKPQTFMNRSGGPTLSLLRRYGISPDRLLVIYDDLALDVGAIRLRPKGGAGGHNGLQDVIRALGSTEFPRLRLGVGNSFDSGQQVDYVLSPFSDEQRPAAAEMVGLAADAALAFATDGLDAAMNRFNRRG